MRILLVVALSILLTGCGAASRTSAVWTGYSENCVDGVTYLQFASGATVKVDRNGKPVSCEGN